MSEPAQPRFALLLPVKGRERAKSRLDLPEPGLRGPLVEAFARDVVAAALRCPLVERVYVVTGDRGLDLPEVTVLPDEGEGDLNAALSAASSAVRRSHPHLAQAAVCADVPCLVPEDLGTALSDGDHRRWFVADAAGTGTTLLAAAPGTDLDPRFGEGSALRHSASGAVAVAAGVPTLRLDVDTAADLDRARSLGVGAHTAAVLGADPADTHRHP